MTTKILTGTYASGYGLHSPTTVLAVAGSSLVEGAGVYTSTSATASYAVVNEGRIQGAPIAGDHGVFLGHGGSVANGALFDTNAVIHGYGAVAIENAAGAVTNFGTITGTSGPGAGAAGDGVLLGAGGVATNGDFVDTTAQIQGYRGVEILGGSGSVTNSGTITAYVSGVILREGGAVTNGSLLAKDALIQGGVRGVDIEGSLGTVTNLGTIAGPGGYGVALDSGGVVTNGSPIDTSALISDYDGVHTQFSSTVTNFGTIEAQFGVGLGKYGGAASLTNFGDIEAENSAFGIGVILNNGADLTNGGASNANATISNYYGVVDANDSSGASTVVNFGVIEGSAGAGIYFSVYAAAGSSVTNGATLGARATIEGHTGVVFESPSANTLTNFGTITGTGGVAVQFSSSADVLVVEAGARFIGSVLGDAGVLDFGSGSGVLTVTQASGALNVSAPEGGATTLFSDFGTLRADAGADYTIAGDGVIAAGQSLVAAGGTFVVSKAITGSGSIAIDSGGTVVAELAVAATIAATFAGGGATLALAEPSMFAAMIAGFAATDTIDLTTVAATSATLESGDRLAVMDGSRVVATLQLAGTYAGDLFRVASDHRGGTDVTLVTAEPWGSAAGAASPQAFAASMAALGARMEGVEGAGPVSTMARLDLPQPTLSTSRT